MIDYPPFDSLATVRPAPPPPKPIAAPPPPREDATVDVECYRNYFLVKFKLLSTGRYVSFAAWTYDGLSEDTSQQELDIVGVRAMLMRVRAFGFNSGGYDMPMITLALAGASCATLKAASDRIIVGRMKPWEFYEEYRLKNGAGSYDYGPAAYVDHVDLMEVAPGVGVSLKMYMGRMHSRRMQDLPIEPGATILAHQRPVLDRYCGNDLDGTHDLLEKLRDRLALRERVGARYGVDVRSKSDAQIAEVVIKARLGFKPQKGFWPHGSTFPYVAPAYVRFRTAELQEVYRIVTTTPFVVHDTDGREMFDEVTGEQIMNGVQLPEAIAGRNIRIGETLYQIGIGGLHSQESKRVSVTTELEEVEDSDVASYYPSLILQLGMFPKQLGARFLEIYRDIYNERLDAKAAASRLQKELDVLSGQSFFTPAEAEALKRRVADAKTIADGFKIVLNGTFGKLGSKYSILYSPDLMIRVTITGQLCLLMLAEAFELAGIRVVSANTDGIVTVTPRALKAERARIVKEWESTTGLEMETTAYRMLASRDVNSYVAVKMDGKTKGKGAYALSGLLENKHPQKDVCVRAVHAYLGKGTPVEETIRASRDIRDFVVIRTVKGGAEYGRLSMFRDKAKKAEREATLRLLGWFETVPGGWILNPSDEYLDNTKAYKVACAAAAIPGTYLGKATRWAYVVNGKPLSYKLSGNKVAGSDGARPFMELPDEMPADIDYQNYIDEAKAMIVDLGVSM